MLSWVVLVSVAASPVTASGLAEKQAGEASSSIQAVRTEGDLRIDGVLDEPAWQQAALFDSFVEIFPQEGDAPSERTELRVLYDDRNLYIGVFCHDSQPELIVYPLGRRDQLPASDQVKILIDPSGSRQRGYSFAVNAGGILSDALLYADNQMALEWDAVWDAAVQLRKDGWSVELAIPLGFLHTDASEARTWGFGVQRFLARTHEELSSVLIPRGSNAVVSRLGRLTGLESLTPRRDLQLLPYVAARAVGRPWPEGAVGPGSRLLYPSFDVGLDLRATLGGSLALSATVNPDFGQVEADENVLNLTNVEQFFPEKRPFFLQGMDLFQPVGAVGGTTPQMLFYSRRIGLLTPILAAAKLTGPVSPHIDVGVLNALVLGAAAPPVEGGPDKRLGFHLARPLHLGPNHELPEQRPVPQNYLAAVVRGRPGDGSSTVGARLVTATPLTGTCTEEDLALDGLARPIGCSAFGGNAAALDWDLRTADARWGVLGQVVGSQIVGGPPSRTLRDGSLLERGDLGAGGFIQGGKLGGEPWRFTASYRYASPTFELNPAGYLPTQNEQFASASLRYVRSNGLAGLYSFDAELGVTSQWTADTRLHQARHLYLMAQGLLPGFFFLKLQVGAQDLGYDIRELPQQGIAFRRAPERYIRLFFESDRTQPFSVDGGGSVVDRRYALPGSPRAGWGAWAEFGTTWRPQERLETRLFLSVETMPYGPRFVDMLSQGRYAFGDLNARFMSITLRQQVVLSPGLTLQAYAQLFTDYGVYGRFYEGSSPDGRKISQGDLVPITYSEDPRFHDAVLDFSGVLRWEYRPGSVLYVVYSRSQSELPASDGELPLASLGPGRLFQGPTQDVLLLKWSYWWNVP